MKPPDDVILLALLLHSEATPCADEVRGALKRFGYELSAQQVAGALRRLSREEMPTVTVKPMRWTPSIKVYELTVSGRTQLGNRWPRLWPCIREIEASRDTGRGS